MLWNGLDEECDFPQNVNCNIDPEALARTKVSTGTYLYMTFDDGPNEGTPYVLDALKEVGVRATFFLNGDNLLDDNPAIVEMNKNSIVRMVSEGHLLGDHSYDHMVHNTINDSPRNAYSGINDDILWFGEKNINPVTTVMQQAGFNEERVINITNTMWNYIRLPFSNNWRVGPIEASCGGCTVGKNSGRNGIILADVLKDEGALVFGWDTEWGINYNINRYKYGGETMFHRLSPNSGTKMRGKIVLLTHDIAHRAGGSLNAKEELVYFLTLAKQKGYDFRTVDTYLTD